MATRYNSAVRHVIVVLVFAAACGNPPSVQRPDHGPGGSSSGSKVGPGSGTVGVGSAVLVTKDVGCPTPTCAYHPTANAYFTCQSGGSGTCFHFGAPCMPEGACMFDPTARSYKLCSKGVEGQCSAWGGACAPRSKCMFDPSDNLHRQCDDVTGGTCRRYGALCAP